MSSRLFTDTHTHLLGTVSVQKPPITIQQFVAQNYQNKVARIVDIWCDVPIGDFWKVPFMFGHEIKVLMEG
jgi:Tat protein secretion system quality control protein TatD with DNase activity